MSATEIRMPVPGPVGRNLIANVQRLCRERGMSMRRLSARLEEVGRPIPPLGLARMMQASRRVDVDELTALSMVFGVTVGELLASPDSTASRHPALREVGNLAGRITELLDVPSDPETGRRHVDRALRRLRIEIEELLESTGSAA